MSGGLLGGFSVHFVEARGYVRVFLDAFEAGAASFDLGSRVELGLRGARLGQRLKQSCIRYIRCDLNLQIMVCNRSLASACHSTGHWPPCVTDEFLNLPAPGCGSDAVVCTDWEGAASLALRT